MKYKVGDRVRIKSLDWYNENKDANNGVRCGNFTFYAAQYCGFTVTIALVNVNAGCYIMKEIDDVWTDEMIEGLVEEEMSLDKAGQITDFEYEGLAYTLPEGYIFKDENGNVINATKIVLEKKKEYPKTYEECCYVLGFENTEMVFEDDYRDINPPKEQWKRLGLMNQFYQLLICRDAYWSIAGEEMGLEKPWEPDFEYDIYYIYYDTHKRIFSKDDCAYGINVNHFLVFPTEEMRDAFYENFEELIEQCKELL